MRVESNMGLKINAVETYLMFQNRCNFETSTIDWEGNGT